MSSNKKKHEKIVFSPLKKTTKPDSLTTITSLFFAQVAVGSDIDRPLPEAPEKPQTESFKKVRTINSYASKKVTTHPDIAHPRQSHYPTMKGFPLQPVGTG